MKILEYYKNLRKKRIVTAAALVVMALVLVVTPLTTHAGTGIYSTDEDGILYVGESMTLTHDVLATDLISSGKEIRFSVLLNNREYVLDESFTNKTVAGLYIERVGNNEMRITNLSCSEEMNINIAHSVIYASISSRFKNYAVEFLISPLEPPKSAFGDLFENLDILLSSMLTFMQQFLTFMTSNPILLIPLIVFLVGVAIFFLARLLKD